jgi:hypothetical protein
MGIFDAKGHPPVDQRLGRFYLMSQLSQFTGKVWAARDGIRGQVTWVGIDGGLGHPESKTYKNRCIHFCLIKSILLFITKSNHGKIRLARLGCFWYNGYRIMVLIEVC